ncbi:MAG TPA: Gfo/Idh/MocA family oxidoreductase, partial [Chitinophagaceae bacterium]|nr:Gfo/Idh/MocA family oxidoreductase [Chitinophagaceae bacterium]
RTAGLAGLGLALSSKEASSKEASSKEASSKEASSKEGGKKVGIIGLDTSHSTAFTKFLNGPTAGSEYFGYKVVAAYPWGSRTIKTSYDRIPEYTKTVKEFGVEIVDSIQALLAKVDVVLLETNDGKPHLEQALEVFKAGKPVFIDKPVAASLKDAIAIYNAAAKYKVPVFSSSSLRYTNGVADILKNEKVGKVLGADCFSPMNTEPSHPDLFWYGIHAVEYLYTVMGPGCKQVTRMFNHENDVTVGVWEDGRVGTVRGIKKGKEDYGGTVYGEKAILQLGTYTGYELLLKEICKFWETGIAPVSPKETLEIYTFMEAADLSKKKNGGAVLLAEVLK